MPIHGHAKKDSCKGMTRDRFLYYHPFDGKEIKVFLCEGCHWLGMRQIDRINDPADPEFGVSVSLSNQHE